MDLGTNYLGLRLRNPLVASASPLSSSLDGIHRLYDAGVGAIVMFSLFEEQLRQRALHRAELLDEPADSFGEALSYFPATAYDDPGPHEYLSLLERAATTTPIPVIASLNGVTPGAWGEYARQMQDAGAAAIELNMYGVPGDPRILGRLLEQRHIDVLQRVKDVVTVPIAVKLSPFFSSIGEMAQRLDKAGADALVLFNRFLQPDINADELAVEPRRDALQPTGGATSPDVHRVAERTGACRTRCHLWRRNSRRCRRLPARWRRRGHDRLRAAASRARVRGSAAGRAGYLDEAQGLPDRRSVPRHARGTGRH